MQIRFSVQKLFQGNSCWQPGHQFSNILVVKKSREVLNVTKSAVSQSES